MDDFVKLKPDDRRRAFEAAGAALLMQAQIVEGQGERNVVATK